MTWTYVVKNTGDVELTNVGVTDNVLGAITCPASTLAVGATMTCTATGAATTDQYTNTGTATGISPNGQTVSDSDDSHYFGKGIEAAIDIEKATNGDDTDVGPGPSVTAGAPVEWTYVVQNTGNVDLTNILISDNLRGNICEQAALAVGESLTCTSNGEGQVGQYENVGRVTADFVAGAGGSVEDEDLSHYLGLESGRAEIDIEKATNGEVADSAPGPDVVVGGAIDWTYVVTNTGDVSLASISVTDDQLGPITCPGDTLAMGASMTCTANGTATAGQYVNTGTATGTAADGEVASDTDESHYLGLDPQTAAISIDTTTNGQDGPSLTVGNAVTWTYVVTNTGNIELAIGVTDSVAGVVVTCPPDTSLAAGASMTCTATGTVVDTAGLPGGAYTNTGSATGTAAGGISATASDASSYTSVTAIGPGITIEKATNGVDADAEPGPTLEVGDAITWTYVVTNNSSVILSPVTVTDDQGVVVTCPTTALGPAGSPAGLDTMTCIGTGTVTAGAYVNVGTATGTTPTGSNITDTDPSHYTGVAPAVSIVIEKSTDDANGNPQDADTAPGPTLSAGTPPTVPPDTVTWTYDVTNDGGAPLTNVTVTDNDGGVTIICPGGILGPTAPPFAAGASFTCTATGVAVQGQYQNRATATGDHAPSGQTVTDSDLSHYFVPTPAAPSIRLEKSTNGADADSPNGLDVPQIPQGQSVSWTYDVTNTGGVDLFFVTVTEDRLGSVCTLTGSGINGLEFLAPNDTASCTATGLAQVGPYDNTGTVTAQAGLQTGAPTVTATDMSHYVDLGPVTIDVEKATNGNDADSTPLPLSVGDAVAWSYVVTNTSGEALTNVAVTDDREGVITCPLVTLPANGTMTCTPKTGVAIEGLYVNVATVTAEAADGRGGTDSDSSSYLGQPVSGGSTAVDIEKFTKGVDADSGPGPNVNVGSSVDWTYVVTNTGTTTIGFNTASGIVVIDDQGETVSCPPAMLAPLESMTCTASGTAVAGPYANVGTPSRFAVSRTASWLPATPTRATTPGWARPSTSRSLRTVSTPTRRPKP